MYCHCSANVCCGAKIVHADESSGPERAATISSVSWLFLVVIPEYRGLSDSVARWIFRLRRFHALARRSGSVFREQQLLLSKNHETHCCSRLPVQNLRSGARKPLGDAPSIATKMVGRIGEWSGSRLETTVGRYCSIAFQDCGRSNGGRASNPTKSRWALGGINHSPPDRAIRRSAAKPRINPLE